MDMKDTQITMRTMTVEKTVGLRGTNASGQIDGPRFVAHVVEGEGDNQPGRIRTIQFDYNGGGQEWLRFEWQHDETRGIRRLDAVHIANRHAKNGAFFLLGAYAEDPDEEVRKNGRKIYERL